MKIPLSTLAAILAAPIPVFADGNGEPMTIPDFTKGDAIPTGTKHDWNLGPTGLRGSIFL
ncbi:MAG: Acetylesterase [Chthoniobacteraceae bacterium]|nr:Acetylesterase [Chthoniobacteraceae bacterium]